VAPGGLLRIDQPAVDGDLEGTAARRDEDQIVDRMLELFEDLGRQTDGLIEVASNRAVLDGDLHRTSRLVSSLTLTRGPRPDSATRRVAAGTAELSFAR
jgi:hypothetical protein